MSTTAGTRGTRYDSGRPDSTANRRQRGASAASASTAPGAGRAEAGSVTMGESVPSKSVNRASVDGTTARAVTSSAGPTSSRRDQDGLRPWPSVPRMTTTLASLMSMGKPPAGKASGVLVTLSDWATATASACQLTSAKYTPVTWVAG
jgi:hypothetical protein